MDLLPFEDCTRELNLPPGVIQSVLKAFYKDDR